MVIGRMQSKPLSINLKNTKQLQGSKKIRTDHQHNILHSLFLTISQIYARTTPKSREISLASFEKKK
ncbi:hypothetical protein HanRHA438_Chr04g0184681 [Helianthus annuus]|nr:hypothetical protein HanRHA438_Chr04g0184681 [Helianthus annuus]